MVRNIFATRPFVFQITQRFDILIPMSDFANDCPSREQ